MIRKTFLYIALTLSLVTGSLSSCLKDSPCYFGMSVTAYTENNYQKIEPVSLYIFNENGTFREKLVTSLASGTNAATFSLNHLPNGNYKLVIWGNEKENITMPSFTPGQSMQDATITLRDESENTCCTTDELFHGYKEISRDDSKNSKEKVLISRNISGVIVTVAGASKDPEVQDVYHVILKGTSHCIPFLNESNNSKINLNSNKKEAAYHLPLNWNQQLLSTGLRYIFPSEDSQKLTVLLYQNDKLIKEYSPETNAQMNKIIEIKLNIGTAGDWFEVVDWYTIGQEEDV